MKYYFAEVMPADMSDELRGALHFTLMEYEQALREGWDTFTLHSRYMSAGLCYFLNKVFRCRFDAEFYLLVKDYCDFRSSSYLGLTVNNNGSIEEALAPRVHFIRQVLGLPILPFDDTFQGRHEEPSSISEE